MASSDNAASQRTSPPRARRRLPPEERRAQLLECAMAVFSRRGLGRAAHAEIATEAGVAVSTAFLYFETREALVDAVLDEVERFYVGMAERIHAQTDVSAREVLRQHGSAFLDSLGTHPHHTRVLLDWSTAFREHVWPRYLELSERLVENHVATIRRGQVEGAIRPDLDVDAAARLHVGSGTFLLNLRLRGMDGSRIREIGRIQLAAALGELQPAATPDAA